MWKKGDRVRNTTTKEEGIVLVRRKDDSFIGGYTAIDTDNDGEANEYGSHSTIKLEWKKIR